jgi:hypothetical protein
LPVVVLKLSQNPRKTNAKVLTLADFLGFVDQFHGICRSHRAKIGARRDSQAANFARKFLHTRAQRSALR